MNRKDLIIHTALSSVLALGLAAASPAGFAAKGDLEKCSGIVKAGKNDCGSANNSCAGTARMDRDKEAWLLVPKGTCEKITGGVVADARPDNKPGGAMEAKK